MLQYNDHSKNMLKKISQLIGVGAVIMLVLSIMPLPQDLPTYAAPGDWKPDSMFPHGTGISHGAAGQIQPVGSEAGTPRTITPANINTDGHVYDCSVSPNNHLAEIDNNHYFPDGIGYSSFNNYRNEFTAAFDPANPPNSFFNSGTNNEVERNYLGGAYDSLPALGAPTDAKDNINLISFADPTRDLYLLAHVHNNASTALNPIGTVDSRSTLPNGGGTKDLSARAVNTRMHFSVPSLALPNASQGTFVNRLRADNAYHVDTGTTCNDLVQQQISDISKVTNSSGQPVTFIVRNGFIQNSFDSTGASNINFTSTALARLVDPSLNQSHISDPRLPSQLSASEGARISSGKSAVGSLRNVPNQPGCNNDADATQQANCNRFADPVLVGSDFDGEWYGSQEFVRYVGINVDAVAAEPRLSVSKLVRSVSPSPEAFNYSGSPWAPTNVTISGNGNGEVEYEVLIQNTGNVDLDDVNFADLLPPAPELAPKQTGPDVIDGTVEICLNLAAAQNPTSPDCVTQLGSPLPLNTSSGNKLVLSSSDMGIDGVSPLHRDPTFITGGDSNNGEVVRIRWRMTTECVPEVDQADNYGLVSGSSSNVPASVVMLDGLTQFSPDPTATSYNITPAQWGTFFPDGAPLGVRQATNQVTVNLQNMCAGKPGITIGKFVRQESPTAETFFPNPHNADDTLGGRTNTIITGTTGGEVQYEVLIENTGSGALDNVSFGDHLPSAPLTLIPGTITTEKCETLIEATLVTDLDCETPRSVPGDPAHIIAGILFIPGDEMGTVGIGPESNRLFLPGEVIRIRWSMISVCTPQGNPPIALNYAMVMASSTTVGTLPVVEPANIQIFAPQVPAHSPPPFVPSEDDMNTEFDPDSRAGPTNDTLVQLNPCSPPPPPGPKKYASLIPHPVGTSFPVPTSFEDAETTGTAVDFGVRTAPYIAYFRVTLTNTGTGATDLTDVIMDDEFHLRNGAPVTPQSVVEPVSSRLDSFDVNTTTSTETALSPDTIKVEYLGASPTTPSGIRFRIPRIKAGQTIAFYYSIVVDPTVAVPARVPGIEFHRNTVRVCLPVPGTPGMTECTDGGSGDAFISDRTPPPTNQVITIIKTVNGQDADTDATGVSVVNGGGLSYAVTVTAPATNTAPVTGIRLTDTVTTLPNVTGITNIRLVTPAGPSTSSFNRNTATATPTNAPPVSNPATIVVPGHREPETDFKIKKEVDPEVVRDGDEVEYTITVEPDGDNDDVADLVLLVTDDMNDDGTLSQGGVTLTYVNNSTDIETDDADCEGEMNDEDGIRCEDVGPDEEITITYKAKVSVRNLTCPETVTVDNTAKLRDDTPNVDIEDEDDAEVRTICSTPPSDRPLNITKRVVPNRIEHGQIAQYTITVYNPNNTAVTTRLTDTIGLNNGVVPGPLGGYARYNANSLQVTGATFVGSIDNPNGVVLNIPALGTATVSYTAIGDTYAQPTNTTDIAPNTAMLDNGLSASTFVELPKTGPEAAAALGLISAIGAYIATRRRK